MSAEGLRDRFGSGTARGLRRPVQAASSGAPAGGRWAGWFVLAWLVGAVGARAAEAAPSSGPPPAARGFDDLLQLFDGSSLHGRLRSMDQTRGVRWEHPDAHQPIDFLPANIAWIRFDESQPVVQRQRPSCRFRFANGDELLGNLLALDERRVELETWFGDRLVAERQALRSMRFLAGNFAILYDGPTGPEGWQFGREPSTWKYRSGTFTAQGVGTMGRDMQMTNSAIIEFDLAWSRQFSLNLALYTSVFDRFDYRNSAYILYLVPGYVSVQRLQGGAGAVSLGQAALPELQDRNRAHFEIRVSKPDATIGLWIDGNFVQRWQDNAGFAPQGSGLTFISQLDGSNLRLSNLFVAEWDGQFDIENDPPPQENEDLIFFANRDRATGALRGVRDGKLFFDALETHFEVPLARVTRILLRELPAAQRTRGPWEMRAYFAGGGAVSFQLEKWDAQGVTGTSANFGHLAFNPRSIRQLRFNLDRGETHGEPQLAPAELDWEFEE